MPTTRKRTLIVAPKNQKAANKAKLCQKPTGSITPQSWYIINSGININAKQKIVTIKKLNTLIIIRIPFYCGGKTNPDFLAL